MARAWDRRPGAITLGLVAVAFVAVFGRVLIGDRVLIPADILYQSLPWQATSASHDAHNSLISDVVVETYPWFTVVREALLNGRLPLWNPYAFAGSPLMGNGQSAPLSPFTLVALPFAPAIGMSLAMLSKLWVAGLGTALFVRQLGARWLPAILGGVAFASSSFMVVWLGWPHTGVAALVTLGFAALEWYIQTGGRRALAGLGAVVGLQFLAGHAETSVHFCGALAIYALVRLLVSGSGRWRRLGAVAVAGGLGVALAAVQLVPFIELLRQDTFYAERVASGIGSGHLGLLNVLTMMIPNRLGTPALTGLGPAPNYNEGVAFAGVWALALAPVGFWWLRSRRASAAWCLAGLGLLSAAVVYGPLALLAGRLPVLSGANNGRLIVVIDFTVAVLGALGLECVLASANIAVTRRAASIVAAGIGALALVALVTAVAIVTTRRNVDDLLPSLGHGSTFWLLVAGVTVVGIGAFVLCAVAGGGASPVGASSPWRCWRQSSSPRLTTASCRPAESPPQSQIMTWLHDHAAGRPVVFAEGAPPEAATLYQVRDEAGYDPFIDQRPLDFWRSASGPVGRWCPPGYSAAIDRPIAGGSCRLRRDSAGRRDCGHIAGAARRRVERGRGRGS